MKKIYPCIVSMLLLSSCFSGSRIEYVGAKSPATENVDVYVDEKAITRSYTIMGKGNLQLSRLGRNNSEKLMAMAIQKARENGADAIFYRETFVSSPGTNIVTHSHSDTAGRGINTVSNASISQNPGYFRTEILFLRYSK